jgi:hypothetical protein
MFQRQREAGQAFFESIGQAINLVKKKQALLF